MDTIYRETKLTASISPSFIIVIAFISFFIVSKGAVSAMGGKNTILNEDAFTLQRKQMVERQIANRGVADKRVLDAMESSPGTCLFRKKTVIIVILIILCR